MRIELKKGSHINLSCGGYCAGFEIDETIGSGASCFVYRAHRIDESGEMCFCRIKECYPVYTSIRREGVGLIWESVEEKRKANQRFCAAHAVLSRLKSCEKTGNNVIKAELWEGNGTLYSIMDVNYGETYDKVKIQTLTQAIDTALVLTKIVGKIHDQGYLHLDIKPENFLVCYDPSTWIWLFDVDSLTSMESLHTRDVMYIPYSQTWAAPEQICGKFNRICPATDIYSIGAILFSSVMGRLVETKDLSPFAVWEFVGPLFEGINPRVKRILRDIFHKTLAASPKQRYQSSNELVNALEGAKKAAQENVYLLPNYPVVTSNFVGRTQELQVIQEAFEGGTKCVVLHGFGGIGKSELAKVYASKHESTYDAVIFARYRGSLKEILSNLKIYNIDVGAENHETELRRLLNDHVLLIIDNFDVALEETSELDDLLEYGARILITSRTDFAEAYAGEVEQIEIGTLSHDELKEIFFRNAGITEISPEESKALEKLLDMVEYHTFATQLLAKQIKSSAFTIEELREKVSLGLGTLSRVEKVCAKKDGVTMKRTILDILRVVFNVLDRSYGQKQTLQNLALLCFTDLDKSEFKEMTFMRLDDLNDLIELGWIQSWPDSNFFPEGKTQIGLHTLVEQMVLLDLKPDREKCPDVFFYAEWTIREYRNYALGGELGAVEEARWKYERDFLSEFFCRVDLQDPYNLEMVLGWFESVRENENDFGEYTLAYDDGHLRNLYNRLGFLMENSTLSCENRFRLAKILFFAWVEQLRYYYIGEDAVSRVHERDEYLRRYFERAKICASQLDARTRESAVKEICDFVIDFDEAYTSIQYGSMDWLKQVYELSKKPYPYSDNQQIDDGKESSQDAISLSVEKDEEFDEGRYVRSFFPEFYSAADACAIRIFQDKRLDTRMKVEILHECLNFRIFDELYRGRRPEFLEQLNWERLLRALDYERRELSNYAAETGEENEIVEYDNDNYINTTIAMGVTRNKEVFSKHMQRILDVAVKDLQQNRKNYEMLRESYFLFGSGLSRFLDVIRALQAMKQAASTISYMLEFIKATECVFDNDGRYIFYQKIVASARVASEEDGVGENERNNYLKIAIEYKKKMRELTGQKFELKNI